MIRKLTTPWGDLTLETADSAVTGVRFGATADLSRVSAADSALMRELAAELTEYFSGTRRSFDLPVENSGTPFQRAVWAALASIPYGEVRTYGEIARMVRHPAAFRATGMACHVNPVVILIPCHRVVAAGGKLGGFGGGLAWKRALLALEAGRNPEPVTF